MRATLVTLILLAPLAAASAATIYKWVDERGVTHYSDQPHPGAQKVEVTAPQTYTAPPPPRPAPPAAAPDAAAAQTGYQRCELAQPVNDQVFFNVQTVTARLRTDPPLRQGDRAVLVLDGRRMPEAGTGVDFSVTPVYRGTHSFIVIVENSLNRELCRTDAVTFHVRQPSTLAPNRAAAPRPP